MSQGESSDASPANDSDASAKSDGGFLTLPIFITEPAIGEGLGAALIYFHRDESTNKPQATTAREISHTAKRSKPPPTATGIFGFYTNNDSTAVGIGHSNTFGEDSWRLVGAAAEARINSQLYLSDQAFDFSIEGSILYAQMKRRLTDGGTFLGLSISYLDAETRFKSSLPGLEDLELFQSGFTDAGLALSLLYDTRDNTILPQSGYLAELMTWNYGENLGGNFDYRKHELKGLYFLPFAAHYVLGIRLDYSTASGDVPFYAAPFVSLRGIPALRYQGKAAGAFELELRRRFGERWAVSVFSGAGAIDTGFEFGETEDEIRSFGVGARYLALPQQDAWVGLDVAHGPEDTAWYVQMGSSW